MTKAALQQGLADALGLPADALDTDILAAVQTLTLKPDVPVDVPVVDVPTEPDALLTRAKAILNPSPQLQQAIAAVDYAQAGKPIRAGSPHTLDARRQRLAELLNA